jgi:N-methylhydantoinase B/oxoprolinase/acetone carboxylase alpha subunit
LSTIEFPNCGVFGGIKSKINPRVVMRSKTRKRMVDGSERKDLRKDDDYGLCIGWYF